MPKWLAIDFGERRVGLAVGSSEFSMAFPRPYVDTRHEDIWLKIAETIREEGVEGIVLGWPERTDGVEGGKVDVVKEFGLELKKRHDSLPIYLQNEAFSSVIAKQKTSHYKTKKKKKQKGNIDSAAAAVFLEEFLNNYALGELPETL